MNPEWYLSNRIIILYYRRYSCGNFLANILAHNNNFVPKFVLSPTEPRYNPRVVELCQQPWSAEVEQELEQLKFELLDTTIPTDANDAINWRNYELGDYEFWGWPVDRFTSPDIKLRSECGYLLKNNKHCFIVTHSFEE